KITMKHINNYTLNIPSVILFDLLLILMISLSPAKKAYGQNFNGGVMVGLVGSQVAGDRFSGFNKAGLTGGGWVSLQVAPTTHYQMELSYIQKGSRENPDYEKEKYDFYRMQLGYVELAVLYRRSVGENLDLEAGPAMNFILHHHEKYNDE